jgi:hypothetical protein
MRGNDYSQSGLFSYFSSEQRVPQDHPLRPIRRMCDEALGAVSSELGKLYSSLGPAFDPARATAAGPAFAGALLSCEKCAIEDESWCSGCSSSLWLLTTWCESGIFPKPLRRDESVHFRRPLGLPTALPKLRSCTVFSHRQAERSKFLTFRSFFSSLFNVPRRALAWRNCVEAEMNPGPAR